MPDTVRETSGATTCLILRYVRGHGGDAAVAEVLRRTGLTHRAADLEDERQWFSFEEKNALFEAASLVLGDRDAARRIGESALQHQVGSGLRVLLRTLGSPRIVVSNVARATAKLTKVARMEVLTLGRRHAVVEYFLDESKQPHSLNCLYIQGMLSVIGPLFGMPLLDVAHDQCCARGDARCVFTVRWTSRRYRSRRETEVYQREQIEALTDQLADMQSTAADLVSADDVSEVLARIVRRASVAVRAPRFVLAVQRLGRGLEVHSDGFTAMQARRLAEELLSHRGSDGSHRIVERIATSERDYGVLAAFDDSNGFFEQEQPLLAAYARLAAAAIDSAGALEEARERQRQTAALLDLAHAVSEVIEPDAVAARLAQAMPSVLGGRAAIVLLTHGSELHTAGVEGFTAEQRAYLGGLTIDRGADPVISAWFDAPEPRLITSESESPTAVALLAFLGVAAFAMVPIGRRGRLLGLASAAYTTDELPADVDTLLDRASAMASYAGTALENAALLSRAQHRARHDELTGLPNRAYFEEQVEQAIERAVRHGTPVTVLFVDLDRFKQANDTFGHDAGDRVLQIVASRLAAETRGGDVVARIGGDEFALMLWDTPESHAMIAAERIRVAVEFPIELDLGMSISASIGLAALRPGERFQELVRRADLAMYEAKRRGRNLCVADAAR